ncbi:MAG: hypothetical protein LBT96_01505 [Campylobacteraceae bacterium]|jgi:hypothetical protein|nr:hypothetical protein [Campylobacteraceae bacterium]
MNKNQKIIHWHEKIFQYLLKIKEGKKNLTFYLRARDNEDRLTNGYWFLGSYYISIGLVKKGDRKNKTKQIALVFNFKDKISYLEITLKSEQDDKIINCYNEISKNLYVFESKYGNYIKRYNESDPIAVIDKFFEHDYETLIGIIKKHALSDELLIDERAFQKSLDKILAIRKTRV